MNETLTDVARFSILISGIIALIRWKQYDRTYTPFVLFIWLGCINEILGKVFIINKMHTTVNNNIYVLLASLLIVWFFDRTGLFKNSRNTPWLIMGLWVLVWLVETFLLRSIHQISSYFRIIFSLVTVLMSISLMNILLVQSKNILREGAFWICTGFIVHFTMKILVEIFWLYGITNEVFQLRVFGILIIVNIFTNLTYVLAALWINKKPPFLLQ